MWYMAVKCIKGGSLFRNRILKRIFGPKMDENERRRLHNEELRSLCSSPCIVKKIKRIIKIARHVARMEEGRMVSNC